MDKESAPQHFKNNSGQALTTLVSIDNDVDSIETDYESSSIPSRYQQLSFPHNEQRFD